MKVRSIHKILGLTLLIPFLGWIITAMVFYFKPGYADAYGILIVKTYPLNEQLIVRPDSTWLETRFVRTILGTHLLVRTSGGWEQLDPATLRTRQRPGLGEVRSLLEDAFSVNPKRYGHVQTVSNDTIMTDTGVRVILGWGNLTLSQRGPDTDRIDLLYRIHYLQWTGIPAIDKILGPLGLTLIFLLSLFGLRLAFATGYINTFQRSQS